MPFARLRLSQHPEHVSAANMDMFDIGCNDGVFLPARKGRFDGAMRPATGRPRFEADIRNLKSLTQFVEYHVRFVLASRERRKEAGPAFEWLIESRHTAASEQRRGDARACRECIADGSHDRVRAMDDLTATGCLAERERKGIEHLTFLEIQEPRGRSGGTEGRQYRRRVPAKLRERNAQ